MQEKDKQIFQCCKKKIKLKTSSARQLVRNKHYSLLIEPLFFISLYCVKKVFKFFISIIFSWNTERCRCWKEGQAGSVTSHSGFTFFVEQAKNYSSSSLLSRSDISWGSNYMDSCSHRRTMSLRTRNKIVFPKIIL